MRTFLFIFFSLFIGCKSAMAKISADAIPEGCSNAVLLMQNIGFPPVKPDCSNC